MKNNSNVYHMNRENIQGAEDTEDEKKKASKKKIRISITCILIVLLLGCVAGGFIYLNSIQYNDYDTISTAEKNYVTAAQYESYGNGLIKLTKDGVSYINGNNDIVWNESYTMKMPIVSVNGEYLTIAAKGENEIYVFNANGKVSSISTPYTINAVEIASQGVVAAILEAPNENYIYLYDKSGDCLVEKKTTLYKDGYPLDIALSEDGTKMLTSYVRINGVNIETGLAAYNFGEVGQNEVDNLVGGFIFEDTLVPNVTFLDNDTICAFGDNQISIYSMKQKPSEQAVIPVNEEILSVFNNSKYLGIVLDNSSTKDENEYKFVLYNTMGKSILEKTFNVSYTSIKMTEKEIIIVGDHQCVIYYLNGNIKFQYNFYESIQEIIPNGRLNEYLVVFDNSTDIIKIKYNKDKEQ